MRIGIYGGTFDPVHLGHLLLAESCREQARLDRVIFIPAGLPPHKQGRELASGKDRAEMLELAIAGHSEFAVDRCEVKRSGPSYSVETLRSLQQDHPADKLFLLMGADSIAEFPTWREPGEIAALSSLVVVNRGSRSHTDFASLVPLLGEQAVARIQVVSMPGVDISSREIRQRVAEKRSVRYLVPRAVERFIVEHHLYQPESAGSGTLAQPH